MIHYEYSWRRELKYATSFMEAIYIGYIFYWERWTTQYLSAEESWKSKTSFIWIMESLSPFNWECWTKWYLSAEESWKSSFVEAVYSTYQKSPIFCFAQLLLQILVNFDLEDLESAGHEVFKTPPTFAIWTSFGWDTGFRIVPHEI